MNPIRATHLVLFAIGMMMVALASGCSNNAKNSQSDITTPPDKREVQQITCVNNLREIGLAFKTWERDHGDQFPCNVSTNAGGAKELCVADKDGFDRNAYLYLKTMIHEGYLTVPGVLVCLQDFSTKPAGRWEDLQPTNITYRFRSGTNVTDANPHEILAVCPVDGNVLYCDGTVAESKTTGDKKSGNLMRVH